MVQLYYVKFQSLLKKIVNLISSKVRPVIILVALTARRLMRLAQRLKRPLV